MFQCMVQVLRSVLNALEALHGAGTSHGAVHPNNIFLTEDSRVLLAESQFITTVSFVFAFVLFLKEANAPKSRKLFRSVPPVDVFQFLLRRARTFRFAIR